MEYESGIETAKKIRAALRRTFPGQTFSVRSSKYSVYVCWLEGPFVSDVEAVLHDFQSYETRSVNGEDQQEAVGYLWEGQRIVGAQYLLTNRCEVLKEADRLAKEIQKTTMSDILAAETN
ncbi:LPD29 domain-containing protein [Paenibacillus elgii]|uniref:LPD29 domain-containing protein n=1 Tax=Paenibacillus elgii TaxID=189691 RepID=UPI0013D28112|nr:LPD29 domain-containing protein [Paenibacillus elgii]